ncbi:hypothetical protein BGY98DRAFT_71415 [Russula aff. rugulosa BPL654]|nr:hypothetical protein BGY98DRAFT_71415 [Russula aff. rugulosa BPL654]
MDSAGWHARRRAAYQDEAASTPYRGPDGHFRPSSHIETTDGVFIGGWVMPTPGQPPPFPPYPDASGSGDASFNVTPPPQFLGPQQFRQTGYPFVHQPGPFMGDTPGSHLSAAERSQAFKHRKRFMDPYLQFTCGPLLRYDNVDSDGVWHGAALIVTADAGSTYEPYPTLMYRWDPRHSVRHNRKYRFTLTAHKASTWARTQPTPMLCMMGVQ